MTKDEFWKLPEATPVPIDPMFRRGFGMAPLKTEGEAYLREWETPDGKPWWSIEGCTKRQTFAAE
jgi:hypothetical protein